MNAIESNPVRYDAKEDCFVVKDKDAEIKLYPEAVKGLYFMTKQLDKIEEFLQSQREYTDEEIRECVLSVCDFSFEEVKEEMLYKMTTANYDSITEVMQDTWNEMIAEPFYKHVSYVLAKEGLEK